MSAPNRKGMGLEDALLVWLAIGAIAVFGGGTYAGAHLGSWMAGIAAPPAHPIDLIAGLIKGKVPWPTQSTVVVCLMAGLILALAVVVLWRGGGV
ncbi:MAG: conjugal transfer protein, partial [Actinomycetes bacterium]